MKTIGTCKDCKNWVIHPGSSCGVRICLSKKICESTTVESDAKDALTYEYYEGGRHEPGPDFGCIHWQPKPGFTPDLSAESPASRWLLEQLTEALKKSEQ